MKHFLLILPALLFLQSCSDNMGLNLSDNTEELTILGEWEWIESTGGVSGDTQTPELTGETKKMIAYSGFMGGKDSVAFKTNGDNTMFGAYTLVKKQSDYYNEERWFLVIEDLDYEPIVTRIEDVLYLTDDIPDGYTHVYERYCGPDEKNALLMGVSGPETGEVGEELIFTVDLAVENGCGEFTDFVVHSNVTDETISPKAIYEGCECSEQIEEFTENYPFKRDSAGEYTLRFYGYDTVIEKNVLIE